MFGTSTFADAPFASEAGSVFACVVNEGMSGTTTVVPVSMYYVVAQDVGQGTVNTSSTFYTNTSVLSAGSTAETLSAQVPFSTTVLNSADTTSTVQTNVDFAVSVVASGLAAEMVSAAATYQTMTTDGAAVLDTDSAGMNVASAVMIAASGTQLNESTTTINTHIREFSTGADMLTTIGDLHVTVINTADGAMGLNVVQQLNTVVSNSAGLSTATFARLLWEVINDYESGAWGTISNAQTVTWANVSTDTDSGWTEIKTLN